ncbi:MAG: LapA family protein [Alphaproteobacteria bacterium]|nr:LapA family protein [Alphaproteobacteria bacterium]
MLKRLLGLVIAIPVGILLVVLALANRHKVPFILDPFQPDAPLLSFNLPLFIYLFVALVLGVVMGGVAAWMTQGRYRRVARTETREAAKWRQEADRLARERDDEVAARQNLMISAGE